MPSALNILGYGFTAFPYVAAALLGLAIPALGAVSYARVGAGVCLIFAMYATEALFMEVGGLQLGIALYYTDFVLLFIAAVAGLRWVFARDFPRRHWGWVVFAAVFLVSLGTGLATFGSGAGVQARPYFYFVVTAGYGMSFRVDEKVLRVVLNALVAAALLLLCITAYRWVVYYTPIRALLPEGGVYNIDGPIRVIRSYEALILAEVVVLALFLPKAARCLMLARVLSPVLLGVVVALQHRSAWIAAIAGTLAALLAGKSRKATGYAQALVIVAIATVTALPLVLSDGLAGVNDQVAASASSAVGGSGTTGERFESWTQIVGNWAAAGPRSIAVGQSFGTDPGRFVHDERGALRKIVYTAHNFYVQTLFNFGLLGLLAYLAATAYVLLGLLRLCRGADAAVEAKAFLVLIAMQLAYYVPYGTDYLQSLIFGAALAYVACRQRAGAQQPEPPGRAAQRPRSSLA